jgi:hypothetical protein
MDANLGHWLIFGVAAFLFLCMIFSWIEIIYSSYTNNKNKKALLNNKEQQLLSQPQLSSANDSHFSVTSRYYYSVFPLPFVSRVHVSTHLENHPSK